MQTDVLNFLLNSNLTLLFAVAVLFWITIGRIDSRIDSLKSEMNSKFERLTERLHEHQLRNQSEHAELNLIVNKILWYLEGKGNLPQSTDIKKTESGVGDKLET